jgi:hypothetical protein
LDELDVQLARGGLGEYALGGAGDGDPGYSVIGDGTPGVDRGDQSVEADHHGVVPRLREPAAIEDGLEAAISVWHPSLSTQARIRLHGRSTTLAMAADPASGRFALAR